MRCSDIVSNKGTSCMCRTIKYIKDDNHERMYRIYHHMRDRCYNEKNDAYRNYGGKGIKVCDEWFNDFKVFKEWSINNGYDNNLTIDRIDSDDDYKPSNCRWVTKSLNTTYANINRGKKQIIYNKVNRLSKG